MREAEFGAPLIKRYLGGARPNLADPFAEKRTVFFPTKPSLLARETLDPSAPQNEDSFIPIAYWFFLCEHHASLTGNINFQDNLLNVLLERERPWETATSVTR